jgi:hypothetical protein
MPDVGSTTKHLSFRTFWVYIMKMLAYLLPLQDVFYFIVNSVRKVEMILELPRPPQATQQQQQEADQPLIQLHSSYFYEGTGS